MKNIAAPLSILVLGLFAFAVIGASGQVGSRQRPQQPDAEAVDKEGWSEARPGYEFSFPRDHAAHAPFRIEWWYYTGNLETAEGRRFGFQLTFFRTGVTVAPANPSRWAVRDLYMAHFAVSDIERQSFHSFERLNRAGVGWAGAETTAYRVWNEDWEARLDGSDHLLSATDGDFKLDLRLAPLKPEITHGLTGVSQKGATVGNASHYYSITRFQTSGRLVVRGQPFDVRGLSWMDHEFGTSFLEQGQTGWDWFSVQLDDGRELMLFQLRRQDGSIDPSSSGTLIDKENRAFHIRPGEFTLTPSETWRSETSGAAYPVAWTIDLPRFALRLSVRAAFPNQELHTPESTGVTYWEGSIIVDGTAEGSRVGGRGYLEMTGYSGQNMGALFR